ncbi:MAG: RsmE family RNA methyltransferase [Candidatus Cloacimonetes bacterium]|nr:RsmE family RNA methyltransferase [Candidatus Cloacimonadota bacterium]
MPSYYTPDLSTSSSVVILEGEEFHHLSHVKRIEVGDSITLNNGKGIIAEGRISELNKRSARIEVLSSQFHEPPAKQFAIAFALLKNKHDELIIEKCTELGASTFFPLVSEYSVRVPSNNTNQRFERIALAAIKQCDNPYLPSIHPSLPLEQVIVAIQDSGFAPILCSERRPDVWLKDIQLGASPCFLIGPEGGWKESEYELFAKHHIPDINISHLILRAETAAIAIAAQFVAL